MRRLSRLLRPIRWPLFFTFILAPALLRAGEAAEPAIPQIDAPPVPVVSNDEMVHKSLQNLNQFLDTNPKVEETLRTNIDQIEQPGFRRQNPAWDEYLKRHPNAVAALHTEKGYLLHRALARISRTRMMRRDVVALDQFLEARPEILEPVRKHPRLLVDSNFLIAHPALGDFLQAHPALSTALVESSTPRKKAPAKPDATKN